MSTGLSPGSQAGQSRFALATALLFGEGAILGLRQSPLVSLYMTVCLLSDLRTEPPAIAVTIIKMIESASLRPGRQASKVGTASELRHAVCLLFSC